VKHPENCEEVFALLSDYLNLELPPEACREVESHLAGCDPCVEFAESLRKTVELCRRYKPSEMPAPLNGQARAELEAAWQRVLAARKPL
jgi:RNA polymerase sigma-70 factor (ECF subfamily)